MFDLAHISILVVVFLFMMTVIKLIPDFVEAYRERFHLNFARTSRDLSRFFIDIHPAKIMALIGGVGLLLGVVTGSWVIAVALAVGGIFAPKIILTVYRSIRAAQVEAQLMDALILLSNSLKSGLDMAAAIERVASSMKPPISEEFGLIINAYRLGSPLEQALLDMTERVPSRSLETVVYAINIQRETGGNIIKTFDQLVETIREESKLQKKVRALTSQARTQITFLAVFPWVLAILFFFLSPDLMRPALQSDIGQMVLVFLIVWEGIGVVVAKKVVRVEM